MIEDIPKKRYAFIHHSVRVKYVPCPVLAHTIRIFWSGFVVLMAVPVYKRYGKPIAHCLFHFSRHSVKTYHGTSPGKRMN